MNPDKPLNERFHVVFGETNSKHWVFRFIRPDFAHVYVIKKSPGGQFWQVLSHRQSHLDLDLVCVDDFPSPMDYALAQDTKVTTILTVDVDLDREANNYRLCIFNCVDCVKGVLGIRDWLCWTPYALYQRLKRGRYGGQFKCSESGKEAGAGAAASVGAAAAEGRVAGG